MCFINNLELDENKLPRLYEINPTVRKICFTNFKSRYDQVVLQSVFKVIQDLHMDIYYLLISEESPSCLTYQTTMKHNLLDCAVLM